ncbi:MAG: DUF1592 domain-containing protein [Myxococcales bacterium]|nr:DUF1592 domain-containing protein [Myxococcales bacterium]
MDTVPSRGLQGDASRAWVALGAMLLASAGCYGGRTGLPDEGEDVPTADGADDDAGEDGEGEPAACGGGLPMVAPRPMRRLTPEQYQSTMRDLLGDPGFVAEYDATEPVIAERGVRQLRDGAELALQRRDQWTAEVFPCDIEGPADDGCADAFIDAFAPRAFRRPLSADERQWLQDAYLDARGQLGFTDSMEVLAATILQAPAMIYLEEQGTPIEGAPEELRRLTDHELASRLSYFLWGSMPDDALRAVADAGELHSEAELRAQVERMLQDPRAEARLQQLMWRWMQLDGGLLHFPLEQADKQPELYPEYDPALQDAMRIELETFVSQVLADDGTLEDLLTSPRAYVNAPLAQLYGVDPGSLGPDEWTWVELPADQRAGLLTRAAFLTVFSSTAAQSPIRRGTFTLEEVLCVELGDPPPNVDDTPVDGGPQSGGGEVLSVREATEARTSDEQCFGCHSVINPVGFAFEHYDAIGRWQDEEVVSGLPVDASARLSGTDVDGALTGALELSQRLSGSAQVHGCFATHWLEEALGGELGQLDDCARDLVIEQFTADGSLHELIATIALSDSFRHVNLAAVEEGE